jgi:simple sugar transport system substrate-binding protein
MLRSPGFTRRRLIQTSAVAATVPLLTTAPAQAATPTVGFVYVGPKNDFGYNQSHAEAVAKLRKAKPGVRILEEEKVPETAAVEKTMESMINLDGANLLFLTSFGYFDPYMLRVAAKYPKVQFRHQGLLWDAAKHPKNTGSYFGYISEAIYCCGVAAAKVSKTRKLGFIAAKPIPAVLRSINSFLLGARSVDPTLTVQVIFTGDWSVPTKEAEATNALANAGVDCVNCHIDDLKVVLGVADQRSMYSFGLNTDQSALAPKGYVTGALYAWDKVYTSFIDDMVGGKPLPNLLQGGFAEGFVKMGPFGHAATPEAQAAVNLAASELASGKRAVFTGPIKDNKGNVIAAAGQKLPVTDAGLSKMNYLLDGVVGSIS